MGKRKPYGRRLFTCLLALLLVAGLVPVLPEAPRALAEEATDVLVLGDDAADEGEPGLDGDATGDVASDGDVAELGESDSGDVVELGDAEPTGAADEGTAAVLDEATEGALLDQLELVAREDLAAGDEDASVEGPVLQAQAVSVSNPRVRADSSMESGQVATWDCVWFGSYPQTEVAPTDAAYASLQSASWDANGDAAVGGKRYRRISKSDATSDYYWSSDGYGSATYRYFRYEPIKWRVLEVSGSTALVVADVALDDQRYNADYADVTWEASSVRSWLNGYGASTNQPSIDFTRKSFIEIAFSTVQKSVILTYDVANSDNTYCGTAGGNDTRDRIFLLSEAEVYDASHGFANKYDTYDEARCCKTSDYARAMGVKRWAYKGYEDNCWWWLRSPGRDATFAVIVDGVVNLAGEGVHYGDFVAVRPALNLNLASSQIQPAGTVSSNGTVNEHPPTGGETIGGGFNPRVNGIGFLHSQDEGKEKSNSVNKLLFSLAGDGLDSSKEVWFKGEYGFNGVSNYANILPSDFRRFFGSVKTNPILHGAATLASLGKWAGSCAGLSTATALSFLGKSEILNRAGKAVLCDIEAPCRNKSVLSLIQCYQLVNFFDPFPKAEYKTSFPFSGSVDYVVKQIITDVREDGVSMIGFDGPDNGSDGNNHMVLATSVSGDINADDGEVSIGLYDVNSSGYQYKATGEPFFTGFYQIEIKVKKLNGAYTEFKFLDANNWVEYLKGNEGGYEVFTQDNTSLRVYDYKREASTPLNNMLVDLPFNLMLMATDSNLRAVGDGGSFGIADGAVYADGHEEVLDGHWAANSVVGGGEGLPTYIAPCSSDSLVVTPEEGGNVCVGLATDDGAYSVDAEGAERITVDGKDGVKIEGDDISLSVVTGADDAEGMSGIRVDGRTGGDVSAVFEGGRLVFDNESAVEDVVVTSTCDGEAVERTLDGPVDSLVVVPAVDGEAGPTVIADAVDVDVSHAKIATIPAKRYTGSKISPKPTVTLDGKTLVEGRDYTVSYKNNVNVGTATVAVMGKGDYAGSAKATFRIVAASVAKAKVTGVKGKTYTGKKLTQAPTVKVGSRTLKKGTDYVLTYKNNVKAGTATMTITGKGNYKGAKSVKFKIAKAANPMAVKAVARTAKLANVRKKAVTVAAPLKFTKKAQGKVTYAKVAKGSSAALTVNKSTGKVTVKKGTKKGTYKVKIKVTAAGNANYKKLSKTITCKVVVK